MFNARCEKLIKVVIAAVVLATLVLSGCVGPRGWPGGVVEGDRLYVGTMDGRVLALNAESGSRFWEWKREVEESFSPFNCIGAGGGGQFGAGMLYGPPVVVDGTVYAASYGGQIYAIRAEDKFDIWDYSTDGSIVGGVAIDNGTLFVGDSTGKLYAIDTSNGELKPGFPFKTEDKIWAKPVVRDGVVYFGSLDHKLYAVDAATGELRWEFETRGGIASTPLIVNGVIYIGSFDYKFYAIDAATGDVKWVFDEASNWFWADALYENGIVYACSLDNSVYAIDASSGELTSAWSSPFDAGSEIKSSPVITGDVLVVASEEGDIYGIDLQNGQERWNIDLEIKVLAPLCASGDTVYVNAQDNRLYAIDGLTGRQDWSVTLVE